MNVELENEHQEMVLVLEFEPLEVDMVLFLTN